MEEVQDIDLESGSADSTQDLIDRWTNSTKSVTTSNPLHSAKTVPGIVGISLKTTDWSEKTTSTNTIANRKTSANASDQPTEKSPLGTPRDNSFHNYETTSDARQQSLSEQDLDPDLDPEPMASADTEPVMEKDYRSYYSYRFTLKSAKEMYHSLLLRRRAAGLPVRTEARTHERQENLPEMNSRTHPDENISINDAQRAGVRAVCLVPQKLPVPPVMFVRGDVVTEISVDMMDEVMADVRDVFIQHFEPYSVPMGNV
jgi:hypothetical protein